VTNPDKHWDYKRQMCEFPSQLIHFLLSRKWQVALTQALTNVIFAINCRFDDAKPNPEIDNRTTRLPVSLLKDHIITRTLASLKLTTWLLCLSMVLIFFGTLDQAQLGIRKVQVLYFQSLATIWYYPENWFLGKTLHWIALPIPGGMLLGPLLILNLLAAHLRYFRFQRKNAGLLMIHMGVLVLLLGQAITDHFQQDYYLWLEDNKPVDYVQSFHANELVVTHELPSGGEGVLSIPEAILKRQKHIEHPKIPFQIHVLAYYPNSVIRKMDASSQSHLLPSADSGLAASMHLQAEPIPLTHNDEERDLPSVIVELRSGTGEIGSWLLNSAFENRLPEQVFEYGGKKWTIALRVQRKYLPITITLRKFEHQTHEGTEISKIIRSDLEIMDPTTEESRSVSLSMNHPFRYQGLTFYQASFGHQNTTSMLQIVSNPGWKLPYLALSLSMFGLILHFTISLTKFLKQRLVS